jgi:hypothetical protein
MDHRSLVQGVEVWVPKGELIVPSSGAYGAHGDFEQITARLAFRRGEGLPGAVWSGGRALVWKDLGVRFVGAELAQAAGIDTLVGLPVHRGREVVAVVVLLLTLRCESPGCVELWDEEDGVLGHGGGHYAGCAPFEALSQLIQFPTGTGLPGGTLAKAQPAMIPDVRRGKSFVRAGLAKASGLKLGVGLPIGPRQRLGQVVTLIAAEEKPFVRAIDLWEVGPHGLRRSGLQQASPVIEPEAGDTSSAELAATVRELGIPRVLSGRASWARGSSHEGTPPFEIALGLPFYEVGTLNRILCLMF